MRINAPFRRMNFNCGELPFLRNSGLMSNSAAMLRLLLVLLFAFSALASPMPIPDGVREIPMQLRSMVYDPFTQRLYATSAEGLVQMNPDSGAVLRTFPLGTNLSQLELGAGRGLWMGADGTGAVQRFNLQTLAVESSIDVRPDTVVLSISPSKVDPYTLAVAVRPPQSDVPEAFLIRNGTVLPRPHPIHYLAMDVNSIYGQYTGNINEYHTDAFGIGGPFRAVASGGGRSTLILTEEYLFSGNGVVWWHTRDVQRLTFPHYPAAGTMTVNAETGQLLYVSIGEGGYQLNRYESDLRHTGHFLLRVPAENPVDFSVAAWSTNRLAFHTRSNLYLVDLDKVFLPADLEVQGQVTSPANPVFGQQVTVTLTVTNHGPGPALAVVVTNLFPAGTLLIEEGIAASITNAIVQAGQTVELTATVLPAVPGVLSTRAGVSSANDPNVANNSRELSFMVALENPRLIRLPAEAVDLAYDPTLERLYFYHIRGNESELAIVSPSEPRLLRPVPLHPWSGVALDAAGGRAILGPIRHSFSVSSYYLIDPSYQQQRIDLFDPPPIRDLKISPGDPQLAVGTDVAGTFILRNGGYARLDDVSGHVALNEAGTVLYRSDAATCALNIFDVGPSALTFQRTVPNVGCGPFVVAGNLLLFNSGGVFDTAANEQTSLGIIPPSFVTKTAPDSVSVLFRTNGVWAVTRFSLPALQAGQITTFPDLPAGVLDAVAAGENRLALRTVSDVYLLELPSQNFGLRAVKFSGGVVKLRFGTAAGRRYQVQRTTSVTAPAWTAFGTEVAGDGFIAEIDAAPGADRAAFFRLAER